jgi:histidinol-phosphate phosphatase family protein
MRRWSAVFLDRDGTLNVKAAGRGYVTRPDELTLLPGVVEGLRRLDDAAVRTFIVTNQRGVAQSLMTLSALDAIHDRLRSILADDGVGISGIYSCVHDVGVCGCRKPLPGLLHQVARDHSDIDLGRSAMVGDTAADVQAGLAVGCTTVRLGNVVDPDATVTVGSLPEAIAWLLA